MVLLTGVSRFMKLLQVILFTFIEARLCSFPIYRVCHGTVNSCAVCRNVLFPESVTDVVWLSTVFAQGMPFC